MVSSSAAASQQSALPLYRACASDSSLIWPRSLLYLEASCKGALLDWILPAVPQKHSTCSCVVATKARAANLSSRAAAKTIVVVATVEVVGPAYDKRYQNLEAV